MAEVIIPIEDDNVQVFVDALSTLKANDTNKTENLELISDTLDGVVNAITDIQEYDTPITSEAFILAPLIIVASGQSNMDGAGSGGVQPAENENVKMFDLTTRTFRNLSYTNRLIRKNVNTGGDIGIPGAAGKNNLAFSFCHEAHKATGRKVYLIIVSNGGTHIGRWVGDESGDVSSHIGGWGGVGVASPLYAELKAAVDEGIALIPDATKIDAMLWHQGETKRVGHESVDLYNTDFQTLRAKLATETWWGRSTQMLGGELIIGSKYDQYQEFYRAFNSAGDPKLKCVSGRGLGAQVESNTTLKIHYNGAGLFELGQRYWRAFNSGDRVALADSYDSTTTEYGAKELYYQQDKTLTESFVIDPLSSRILENKGIASGRVGGGFNAGQRVINNDNCTITHNIDGTFKVQPLLNVSKNWSFDIEDYWIEGPAVTNTVKITGLVPTEIVEKCRLRLDGGTEVSITLNFVPYLDTQLNNNLLTIDWGDGVVETGLSSGVNEHIYATAFSGEVIIKLPIFSEISTLQLTKGEWCFPLSNLMNLNGLGFLQISSSSNKVFGNIADLPESITNLNIAGNNTVRWNFTGLRKLATFEVGGLLNTINSDDNGFESSASIAKFILRGANRTSAQIDSILIALALAPNWNSGALLYLAYSGQGVRTTASDAAVAALVAKGANVVTN